MSSVDLPLEMRTALQSVGWRRWTQNWLIGNATVIAGALLTVLLWLWADAFFNLPGTVRAAGQWVGVAVVVMLAGWMFRRAVQQRVDDSALARTIDQAYPELQERFSTCRDLLQQPIPTTRMGRWFRGQLQRETLPQLTAIDPVRVVSDREALFAIGIMLGIVLVGFAPLGWWGEGYIHLGARWWNPSANLGWGRFAGITITPRDGFAVRDRDFTFTATYKLYRSNGDTQPPLMVHWRTLGDRTWEERPLQAREFGLYDGIIPHVPRDIEWYVSGPAVESPRAITRVVEPPEVVALTAAIDPPGYTGQPSRQTSVVGDLAVLAGSRVQLSMAWNQPLQQAELLWPNNHRPDELSSYSITLQDGGTRGTVDVVATKSGPFSLRLTTPQGLVINEPSRSLSVRPDQKPVVKLDGPTSLALRPDERHEIAAHTVDDYGLTAAELHIEIADRTLEPIPLRLPAGRVTTADVATTIDLLPLKLAPGSSVLLRVRVLDNREQPGPQEGWSVPQVIVISPSAISDAERRLADNTRQSRNELGALIKELEEERTTLRDIHQKTAEATVRQKQAEQTERLKEIATAHADLQQRVSDFAAMLPDDEPGEALRQQTEAVVNGPLESAAERLEATPKLEPRDQIPTLSKALDDLAAAKKALQKIDDALIARSALGDDLQTLRQLANRSDRIAEEVEKTADESTPSAASQEVQQIREELSQVVKRRPEWQTAMKQAEQASRQQQLEAQAADQPVSALLPENKESAPKTSPPAPSGPVPVEAGAELSKAQQQLQDAQSQLLPDPIENTAGSAAVAALQDAARALRAAIEKTAGPQPRETPLGRGIETVNQAGEASEIGTEATLTDFTGRSNKGTSNRNWGRLPTGLKTEILQGTRRPAHGDYARQVQRYFERIAQPTEGTP